MTSAANKTDMDIADYDAQRGSQRQQWTFLVEKLYQQIRYGCENQYCMTRTCRSYQTRVHHEQGRLYRAPARTTATALATALASEPDSHLKLCKSRLKPMDGNDRAFAGTPAGQAIDTKSLLQQLYNTKAWRAIGANNRQPSQKLQRLHHALETLLHGSFNSFSSLAQALEHELIQAGDFQTWIDDDFDACFEYMSSKLHKVSTGALGMVTQEKDGQQPDDLSWCTLTTTAALLVILLESHPHEFPEQNWTQWISFSVAVASGPLKSIANTPTNAPAFYKYLHIALSRPALNCATKFFHRLYEIDGYKKFFDFVYTTAEEAPSGTDMNSLSPMYRDSLMEVLCVWAKLVFRDNWRLQPVLDTSSHELSALQFLHNLISYNDKNVWPFYKETYGLMSIVGDKIDIVKEPPKWLRRQAEEPGVHLLQYKWLFSQRERVVFFRAMNFHRMLSSFEQAMEANTLMVRMYNLYRESSSSLSRREEIFAHMKSAVTQCLTLQVSRTSILEDALNQLWRREPRELLRPMKVKFGGELGEEGIDLGGLQQEFFRMALAESLDPKTGLFTVDSTNQMAWFKALSPAPLYQYALIGMLFGLAIYNGVTLPVNFPHYFYRWLMSSDETSLEDLKDGWPDVYSGLKACQDYIEPDFEDVFSVNKTFTVDVIGRRVELDMDRPFPRCMNDLIAEETQFKSGHEAAAVTSENRHEYIEAYVRWLLTESVKPQMDAFLKGFRFLFTQKVLDILTPDDFHKMVEGEREIDVAELKRVTRYEDGYHADDQTIRDFWQIVETYKPEDLKALLEFVTATDRMPVAGMQDLVFVIMKSGDGGTHGKRLPSSHTCFNRLMLPAYPSKEILADRLQVVLRNSEGFGLA